MKLLTRCLLVALFGTIFSISYAQTVSTGIEGKVMNEASEPAEAATIRLLNYPDSMLVGTTITDKNGFFKFDNIRPGNYFIGISKVGYKMFYSVNYQLANASIKATDVKLVPLTYQLKEVKIVDKKQLVEVRPDKTVINVEKSIVSAGANMLDMLKNAPGVKVVNDEVLFKGGQKALIAINGKVTMFTGEQLAELLKSYQSGQVSQVELIDNPPAKYDAAGGGLINIVLKKNKDLGWRATITESAAIGQNYKLNSSINLNYRTKKLNLFGTYTYVNNKIPRMWEIDRTIATADGIAGYDVRYKGVTKASNHNFNIGGDLSLTPKQNLGVIVSGYSNNAGIDKSNTTYLRTNGRLDSTILTSSFIDRDISNLNYNLNYRGVFGKDDKNTLSADADYAKYDRKSIEDLVNTFENVEGATYRDPLYFLVASPSDIDVYSFKTDYSRKVNANNSFDAGFKISQVNSTNKIDFKELDNGAYQLVPALTDHFVYKERIYAGYGSYSGRFGKTSVNAGLRLERTTADRRSYNPDRGGDTSYFNIFPTVQIIHELNDDHQLTLSYNRRIARPNYQDLNPFVAYIDQYAYSVGNPFLRPQYVSSIELADTYLIKFKGAVGINMTKDFNLNIFKQDDATGVYTTTKENIGSRYQVYAEVRAPFDVTEWWQVNSYVEGTFGRYNYTTPGAIDRNTYDLYVQVTNSFTINAKTKAEINGNYETPTYYGIKNYREQYYFSAGVSRTIIRDQGTIRLAVSDIFNTQIDRYSTRYLNLNLRGREKPGTRFVTATFTYRFGNNSLKNARKRTGGSVDEVSRLSGSSNEN